MEQESSRWLLLTNIDESIANSDELFHQVLVDLDKFRDNPRLLIVLSCSMAELFVSVLIEEHCREGKKISEDNRTYPFSARLTLLYELGIMTEKQYEVFNWLRRRRNKAAHEARFQFTSVDMPEWGKPWHTEPEHLWSLCTNMLGGLWNSHVSLFSRELVMP